MSPSLRGSGLKFRNNSSIYITSHVSLFTREWIEITSFAIVATYASRLPLYEGVDWNTYDAIYRLLNNGLPLYEGVDWNDLEGLFSDAASCLPLYEGVDWNGGTTIRHGVINSSPSLRGSGLKYQSAGRAENGITSPSLRGSGLKSKLMDCIRQQERVSLFTREWIEIAFQLSGRNFERSLPLYEGVDWNQP